MATGKPWRGRFVAKNNHLIRLKISNPSLFGKSQTAPYITLFYGLRLTCTEIESNELRGSIVLLLTIFKASVTESG